MVFCVIVMNFMLLMELGSFAIVEHFVYIFLIIAFMLRNVVYLRLVTLLSSLFAIIYYRFGLETPLWIGIGWETLFSLVNLFQLFMIAYERYFIRFSPEEKKIRQLFSKFSPLQFKKLLKTGAFKNYNPGDYIIKHGQKVELLSIICTGTTDIINNEKILASCGPGAFLGELSFMSGNPATADVKATSNCLCICWDQKNLRKLLEKDEDIFIRLQITFNEELARKVVMTNR